MKYVVDRHSGRSSGGWRVVLDTDDEARARGLYATLRGELRQGTVRLHIDGKQELSTSAPRLRRRW